MRMHFSDWVKWSDELVIGLGRWCPRLPSFSYSPSFRVDNMESVTLCVFCPECKTGKSHFSYIHKHYFGVLIAVCNGYTHLPSTEFCWLIRSTRIRDLLGLICLYEETRQAINVPAYILANPSPLSLCDYVFPPLLFQQQFAHISIYSAKALSRLHSLPSETPE